MVSILVGGVETMMDTTNSLNSNGVLKCKPRMHFKINGTSKVVMSGSRKSIKETRSSPESDGSSSSSSSSSTSSTSKRSSRSNRMNQLPHKNSLHSRSSHSGQTRRSSLKVTKQVPPPDSDLSDHEEYGEIMKDYCYNENNVLVPRQKLHTNGVSSQADPPASPSSGSFRVRRGGRRPGYAADESNEDANAEPLSNSSRHGKPQRRRGNFSFWDQDTDSSESENEILQTSPSKETKYCMKAMSRRNPSFVSKSDSSNDYFTAQEEAPERKAPARNNSGWYEGGSFESSDEDEPEPPKKPNSNNNSNNNNIFKLSQAALRMSRQEGGASFSFTKKNGKMDNYKLNPALKNADEAPAPVENAGEQEADNDDSNHSSASKTSASFVSAGGWSTGKDTSSDEEDEEEENRRKAAAIKKSASSKRLGRARVESAIEQQKKEEKKKLDAFDKIFTEDKSPKRGLNVSGHSADSKFSFVSANSASFESGSTLTDDAEEAEEVISPLTSSVASRRLSIESLKEGGDSMKLDSLAEENGESYVFDLSAMNLSAEGLEEDGDADQVASLLKKAKSPATRASADEEPQKADESKEEKERRRSHKKAKKEKEKEKESKQSSDGKKDKDKKHKKKDKDALGHSSEHVTKKEKSKSSKHKKEKDPLKAASEHAANKDKEKSKSSKHKKEKDSAKDESKTKKHKEKKKSTDTSVASPTKEPKEEKVQAKDMEDTTPKTAQDLYLEKRRQERAARLEKAKERIRQQKEDNDEAAAMESKMKTALETKKPATDSTEAQRRERAYMWYTRCGMPTKQNLKSRIPTIPSCDITEDDVDLLPWMTGDRMVNVATMMKLLREK